MAKKAKVSVRGYFKDLMGWFGLMKARQAWIDAGDPNIDTTDNAAKLAKELHADAVNAKIIKIKDIKQKIILNHMLEALNLMQLPKPQVRL